jgi:hypothetical protein
VPNSGAQGVRGLTGHPKRWAGGLKRERADGRLVQGEVGSPIADSFSAEGAIEDLDAFAQALATAPAVQEVDPESRVLARFRAASDSRVEATSGDLIDR